MTFLPVPLEQIVHQWPPELDHLSAGSLKMAVRCPEQWRQRYILKVKEPPALALMVGGADHKAIETSMEQKISSGVDLPTATVQEAFVAEVEKRVEGVGGIGEVEVSKGSERLTDKAAKMKVYDTERSHGQVVVAAYHEKVSPAWQPLTVERSFELQVPELPVKMIGYIDLVAEPVQQSLNGTERRVIDRKRTKSAKSRPEPEWVMQTEVYQLVESLPFEFHISVHGVQKPYVLTPGQKEALAVPLAPRKRSELLLQGIAAEIGFYYMRFGPDHPWPAKGKLHPWACNYCGFRPDCWGWK